MNKKITYLLLALALPGLIFIFLKIFGKNHFDIPIYYKDGIPNMQKECSAIYSGQYNLSDTSLIALKYKSGKACLFVETSEMNKKEISQLRHLYSEDQLQIIPLAGIEPGRLNRIRNCVLFLHEPWKAVLTDNRKRIRGYYAFTNLEETDRLKVELEILITNN